MVSLIEDVKGVFTCRSLLSRSLSCVSCCAVTCWLRPRLGRRIVALRGGAIVTVVVHEEFPVDQTQHYQAHNGPGNDSLEVLHPELVLHGSGLLLELSTAVLEGISPLLQVPQLPVPLQDILHVGVHDPDDLLDLGLLLGHLPGCLDLPDLCRARDGLAIRSQGPGGSFLAWGGHDDSVWSPAHSHTVTTLSQGTTAADWACDLTRLAIWGKYLSQSAAVVDRERDLNIEMTTFCFNKCTKFI